MASLGERTRSTDVAMPGDPGDLVWRTSARTPVEGRGHRVRQEACGGRTTDLHVDVVAERRHPVPSRREHPRENHASGRGRRTRHAVAGAWQPGLHLRLSNAPFRLQMATPRQIMSATAPPRTTASSMSFTLPSLQQALPVARDHGAVVPSTHAPGSVVGSLSRLLM